MRILFMGTPDFAVDTLTELLNSRHEVIGVVTQPDKPKGRGGKMQCSPVKEVAVKENICVYQPVKVRDEAFLYEVRRLDPDVIVVVAFGQMLSKELLEMPKYGCINVHASLLPKLRGAAPIQWAVITGEKETGVTIMQMDEGIDTGDILMMEKYTLEEKETGGSLFEHLAKLGGPLLLKALDAVEKEELQPIPQNDEEHTYAKMLNKATGKIDFSMDACSIERLIRGLNPWPSAYCYLQNKMLKIWEADVVECEEAKEKGCILTDGEAGKVVLVTKKELLVQTANGCLSLKSVQLEGKKRMDIEAFLRGFHVQEGEYLKSEKDV